MQLGGRVNSTTSARDRRAVAQGAALGPGDLRMDAATQAAVSAADDVFPANSFSKGCASGCATKEKPRGRVLKDLTLNLSLGVRQIRVSPT